MITEDIRQEILQRIHKAEKEHHVKVLYAVESGSRAWGFASPNSDYDVRFIYAHPQDWYLSVNIEKKRDVIEYDIVDEIDINGWDIRKALQLFQKSNPAFIEWLQSPIIYVDDGVFATQVRAFIPEIYSFERGIYHYRSMAKTNYRGYLREDIVPLKKYFYVLRPLLSIKWLEKYQTPAPIEFARLRELIHDETELNSAIEILLERKKQSLEKEMAPSVPILNEFIVSELERLEHYKIVPDNIKSNEHMLDSLFQQIIIDIQ